MKTLKDYTERLKEIGSLLDKALAALKEGDNEKFQSLSAESIAAHAEHMFLLKFISQLQILHCEVIGNENFIDDELKTLLDL